MSVLALLKNKTSLMLLIGIGLLTTTHAFSETITLSKHCPPGFQLQQEQCLLRSRYQQFRSIQNQGVGGLKTGLPDYRDGFSPQQIDLGRYLFFDPILSANKTQSCASCHNPNKGFADGKATSVGALGAKGTRSAPSLWNVAFSTSFFWDARAASLEEQMLGPLYSPIEMANNPTNLLTTLNNIPLYQQLFKQAFNSQQGIQLSEIYTALTAFQTSLISLNSRYDQYALGYHDALTDNEIEGMNVFRSFVARCAECHTPPLFTNQQIAVIGTPEPKGNPRDIGAAGPFKNATMRGGFKVPTLRNIELTAPYMHSGKYNSLWDATEFYTLGRGHAVPENEKLYLHWHIWEPNLTDAEIDRLVDFMLTLNDESFKPVTPNEVPSGISLKAREKN